MNKNLIQKRFEKNLCSYNDNAKIQKKMAQRLIELLPKKEFNSILEVGCGSGLLTKLMLENLSFNKYVANDIVKSCSQYIENLSPDIDFICADIEDIIKNSTNKYDLIISNATFQWIEDFEGFIKHLFTKLNPNGILIFSTFGQENFREIYHVLGKSLSYRNVKDYEAMLKGIEHKIDEEVHVLAFKTPLDVLKHIKSTGVNALDETYWTKTDLINFEKGYNNFCSSHPTLTYNPIYIKLENSSHG